MSTNFEYLEKPLPSSPEAERVILGAILLDNALISQAVESLKVDDFYSPLHGRIFKAMTVLFERGQGIDPILIGEELKKEGLLENIGGIATITNLTFGLPHFSEVETYTKVVKDKSIARNIVRACGEITNVVLDEVESIESVSNFAEQKIFATCERQNNSRPEKAGNLARRSIENTIKISKGEIKTVGTSTGFADIDKLTNGFRPSDLIVIAARPSIGKSALVHQIAFNAAEAGNVVAIFSPEMSKEQIIERIICTQGKIDSGRYRTGRVYKEEWREIANIQDKLDHLNLIIDDTPSITPMELLAKSRRIFAEYKRLDLIGIDYMQLMSPSRKTESETGDVTQISKELKAIAKLLKVPLIAISSLNRESEKRANHKPQMSDLRQSGQIEFDADVVAFLHRDEYYRATDENAGIAEFIIAKQRNGPTETVKLAFQKEFTRFEDYFEQSYSTSNYYERENQ